MIGQCLHATPQEFLKFLRHLDREFPEELELHLILDNYRTHKHAKVDAWLEQHPRFHLHFTPTSSSWLNLVERSFRELTEKAIRRGVFHSVPDLIAAIEDYLSAHNEDPSHSFGPPRSTPSSRRWAGESCFRDGDAGVAC